MRALLARAWRAYWKRVARPVRTVARGMEIERLRKEGLSSTEIIKRLES